MKRKFISIFIALVLVLSFSLVVAAPVSAAPATVWHVPDDFDTIEEAVDGANPGDKIIVAAGEWDGAIVDEAVEIRGEEGAVIVDGSPLGPGECGFRIASDGVTISHFTFEVEFPVYSRAFDDVTVEHNVMIDPIQGVTNWHGSGWTIKHNVITGLWDFTGGGIGIFIGASEGLPARDNLVAFNKITGDFSEDEERGYSCTGICLYTKDGEVTGNKVVHNDVLITGWEAYAIDMTFSWFTPEGIEPQEVLYDNKIGFNDLRGSSVEIGCTLANPDRDGYLSPEEATALMEEYNSISRNLGDNRAYDGIPAREFRPVTED